MVAREEEKVALLAKEIQDYLESNPLAADSIKGIQRWWISSELSDALPDLVEQALNRLVAQGVIAQTVIGNTVVYRKAGAMRESGQGGHLRDED